MNRTEAQQVHLLIEPRSLAPEPIPVRPGISRLHPGGTPFLTPADMGSESPSIWIEPVMNSHGQLRLLLHNSTAFPARVNGTVPPLVAVLKERDCVQFADGSAAHVSVLHRPQIGVPPPDLIGRECLVCRVAFTASTRCYVCACGVALHMEESAEGLQCVQTRTECVCGRRIILKEGFSYQPDM